MDHFFRLDFRARDSSLPNRKHPRHGRRTPDQLSDKEHSNKCRLVQLQVGSQVIASSELATRSKSRSKTPSPSLIVHACGAHSRESSPKSKKCVHFVPALTTTTQLKSTPDKKPKDHFTFDFEPEEEDQASSPMLRSPKITVELVDKPVSSIPKAGSMTLLQPSPTLSRVSIKSA